MHWIKGPGNQTMHLGSTEQQRRTFCKLLHKRRTLHLSDHTAPAWERPAHSSRPGRVAQCRRDKDLIVHVWW